jgi:hypothetical protein
MTDASVDHVTPTQKKSPEESLVVLGALAQPQSTEDMRSIGGGKAER